MSEINPEVHVCGKCNNKFSKLEDYLNHKCQNTGFQPIQPENLGKNFEKIQEASLKRGEARKEVKTVEGEPVAMTS